MDRLLTLGELALVESGSPDARVPLGHVKRHALLVYLAVEKPAGAHARDRIQALFWPEADDRRSRDALKQLLKSLRGDLGDGLLEISKGGRLALDRSRLACDAVDLVAAAERGDHERVLSLYGGDFLPGFHLRGVPEFDDWVLQCRRTFRELAAESATFLGAEREEAGATADAAELFERALKLRPFDEVILRRLLGLLIEQGDNARAIGLYETFAEHLDRELGIEPAPETSDVRELAANRMRTVPVDRPPPTKPPERAPTPHAHRRSRVPRLAGVTALLAVATLLGLRWAGGGEPEAEAPARIALVPFQTLAGSDSTFFAAGLTEEIRVRLNRLLGVELVYAGGGEAARDVESLAQELDIDFVLSGTVRWETVPGGPARVRVVPRLLRADDRAAVWTETYETYLEGIFDVQARIGREVASALGEEVLGMDEPPVQPTDNVQAYIHYLRGQEFLDREWIEAPLLLAADMFREAVRLDPDYAKAWAGLSLARSELYMGGWGTEETRRLAVEAARRAEAIAPGDPDVRFASAMIDYRIDLDFESALEELNEVERLRPNDPDVLLAKAYIERRRGSWEQAVMLQRRALELEPLVARGRGGLAWTLINLRRYQEARDVMRRARELFPDMPGFHETAAVLELIGFGDTGRARQILEEGEDRVGAPLSTDAWLTLAIWARDAELARSRFDPSVAGGCGSCRVTEGGLELGLLDGFLPEEIRVETLLAMRDDLAESVRRAPDDPVSRSLLALAHAGLGSSDEALSEAEAAAALLPVSRDAVEGPRVLERMARVHALVGDPDRAIDLLDFLLGTPSEVSVEMVRRHPRYDRLRAVPGFAAVLARHE